MNQQKNTVRIFISSTFKDMHSERDYLATTVFPELKKRCMHRGLNLVEVDLRWGITEEEHQRGKVLEICIEEINKCKPFFIGILGERYGEPIKKKRRKGSLFQFFFSFIKSLKSSPFHGQEISYTAYEIYQGVLKNPKLRPRAFFYYRDPAFIKDVPECKVKEIRGNSDAELLKLQRLKNNISETFTRNKIPGHISKQPYPCSYKGLKIYWDLAEMLLSASQEQSRDLELIKSLHERFGDLNILDNTAFYSLTPAEQEVFHKYSFVYLENLDTFGKEVADHLWRAISEEYPVISVPESSTEIENHFHDQFADQLSSLFIGREKELSQLLRYINDYDTRPFCIKGEPGCGKSALLAFLIRKVKKVKPDLFVISHFTGASPDSVDMCKSIIRLITGIRSNCKLPFDDELPYDLALLKLKFRETLQLASRKKCKILLIVDAVNQFNSSDISANITWIPSKLPGNVKMIFSTTGEGQKKLLEKFGFIVSEIENLSHDQSSRIITQLLGAYRKKISASQLGDILSRSDANKPLYLKVVCEELRFFPSYKLLPFKIKELPNSVSGIFENVFERLEEFGKELCRDILSLIESSEVGLYEHELLELLNESNKSIPIHKWLTFYYGLSPYLRETGLDHQGLISFFHSQMREAIRTRYLQDTAIKQHYYKRLYIYGNHLTEQIEFSGIPLHKDHLNCFWDSAIYLLKWDPPDLVSRCKRLFEMVFTSSSEKRSFYITQIDRMIFYIINTPSSDEQNRFKSLVNSVCDEIDSEELAEYLLNMGTRFRFYSYSRWVCLFFSISNKIFQRLYKKFPTDELIERNLSVTYSLLGDIHKTLNQSALAMECYQADLSIAQNRYDQNTRDIKNVIDISVSLNKNAHLYTEMNNLRKAYLLYLRSLYTLNKSLSTTVGETGLLINISENHIKLGELRFLNSNFRKAKILYGQALEIRNQIYDVDHTNKDSVLRLAIVSEKLSQCSLKMGLITEALEFQSKSISLSESILEKVFFDEEIIYLVAHNYEILGDIYALAGDGNGSLNSYTKAIDYKNILYEMDIQNIKHARDLSIILNKKGDLHLKRLDDTKALDLYLQAYEIRIELYENDKQNGENARNLSIIMDRIGNLHFENNKLDKALDYFLKSLKIREELYSEDSKNPEKARDLCISYQRTGATYLELRNMDEALKFYLKDFDKANEIYKQDQSNTIKIRDLALSQLKLGTYYSKIGDHPKMLINYQQALAIQKKVFFAHKDDIEIASDYSNFLNKLGDHFKTEREANTALLYYSESYEVRKRLYKTTENSFSSAIELVIICYKIYQVYEILMDKDKMCSFLQEAIAVLEQLNGQQKLKEYPEYFNWLLAFKKKYTVHCQ